MIPENLSGRSAGLADGLAYVEYLGIGDLSGDRVVAATGVIDGSGNVSEVSGIRFKTEAAIQAGASILFVPRVNLAEARIAAELYQGRARLQIVPVHSLREAVMVLCARRATTDEACAVLHATGD
jgi:PDZ domain-containing protein